MREFDFHVQFEPRDLWVGLYWHIESVFRLRWVHVYICVVPMFPLHFTFRLGDKGEVEQHD